MTAEQEMILEVQKIMAKYQSERLSETTKHGIERAKAKRIKRARDKINDLLLVVEFDIIWQMVQQHLDAMSEKQLAVVIRSMEGTLSPFTEDEENTFPPKEMD